MDIFAPMFKDQDKRIKKLIDGTVKAFMTVDDKKGLEIITKFADFNEILTNYINSLAQKA